MPALGAASTRGGSPPIRQGARRCRPTQLSSLQKAHFCDRHHIVSAVCGASLPVVDCECHLRRFFLKTQPRNWRGFSLRFSPQPEDLLGCLLVMGLPGKPKGFDGGGALLPRGQDQGDRRLLRDRRSRHLPGGLRYELFRGTLSQNAFEASERNLADFMNRKANS